MKFDVIAIGTATRDVFLKSPLFKVVRDPSHLEKLGFPTGEAQCFALGGKLEVGQPVLAFGGGAANAATTFRRQGMKTAVIAKIGNDENGEAITDHLKKEKIIPLVAPDRREGTAYSVVLISPSGERTILTYRGASEDLAKKDIPLSKINAKAAYVVPGRIDFTVIRDAVRALKRKGTFVMMNPSQHYLDLGAARLAPLLKEVDVILVNREEAAYLTGEKFEHEDRIFKKFDKLVTGIAVMTDGPKGVFVSDGRTVYSAGVYPDQNVVNRTGAGDAFGSGFLTGLLRAGALTRGISPEAVRYAMRLASANATGVVEHMGAQTGVLTRKQFDAERRWKNFTIKTRRLA